MKKTENYLAGKFITKIHVPLGMEHVRVGLMLHGWTGDETSMWVFANKLEEDWFLISPRAPYLSQGSISQGFSWVDKGIDHWPEFRDFLPAVHDLHLALKEIADNFPQVDFSQITVFGFSQGAAAAFVYSMIHQAQVAKLGMLSGFLPDNCEAFIQRPSQQSPRIFIGHGSQDHIVPVSKAEQGTQILRQAGYTPHVCISDVGHRLGADCFNAFSYFMNSR